MRKLFTKEEIEVLSQNPNVQKVTENNIQYTPEFKKQAFFEMIEGKTAREIFTENGIDPEILGDTRVYSFTNNLKRKSVDDNLDFRDKRKYGHRFVSDTDKEIEYLRNENAYLKQENEFLKKTQKADLEAQRIWESRRRRLLNSR